LGILFPPGSTQGNEGLCVDVAECDAGTDADLTEWLSSIGIDSDVADKVRLSGLNFVV